MSQKLKGKVAVVTASTDGIGLAIVKRLALDGAKVMVSSRQQANVTRAVEYLKGTPGISIDQVRGVVCHVGIKEHRDRLIQETLKEFGHVDILISNAAVNQLKLSKTLDCTEEGWDKIFNTNVKAAFLLTKEFKPYLKSGGSIIFMASAAGYIASPVAAHLGPYSLSKTTLLGLTKMLSYELGPENIRVNCIAPGLIKTNFASMLTEESKKRLYLKFIPLGRYGTPEDIAGIASFLSSDDAAYITGENIVVAGGVQSRL